MTSNGNTEKTTKMARDKDDKDLPKITVTKLTPQLMSLWNKELERLHKALIAAETAPEDKEWVKKQIEQLHSKVFGDG